MGLIINFVSILSHVQEYILVVNHEAMPLLYFCAYLLHFYAPSYTSVLFPHYTPMHSSYSSSTPTLIMTPSLCYNADRSRPPVRYNFIIPVV